MTSREPVVPDVDGVYPDLATFLLARLDERALAIRTAVGSSAGARLTWNGIEVWTADTALADVAAKRRIVDRYLFAVRRAEEFRQEGRRQRSVEDLRAVLALVLCELASAHAEHPDYRQEWRP